jgi:hypothetical protein
MNVVELRQQEADLEIKIAPLEGEELAQSQSGADRTEGSEFEDKSRASQMNAGAKQETASGSTSFMPIRGRRTAPSTVSMNQRATRQFRPAASGTSFLVMTGGSDSFRSSVISVVPGVESFTAIKPYSFAHHSSPS